MAWAGQTLTQRPQPVQRSELTWATDIPGEIGIGPGSGLCTGGPAGNVIGIIGGCATRPRPPLRRRRI